MIHLHLPAKPAPKPDTDLTGIGAVAKSIDNLALSIKVAPKDLAVELQPARDGFMLGAAVGVLAGLLLAVLLGLFGKRSGT